MAMIKSTSIGVGPKIIQSEPEQPASSNVTSQPTVETQTPIQIKAANTSITAESQLAGVALRTQLQNQLQNENQWMNNPELKRFKLPDKSEASNWGYLPKTLTTGDGDDKVDIKMGSDGRVHVNVNGKEAWSGTTRQFQALTIDTGKGKDFVNNEVDGATIVTGDGNDEVWNTGLNVNINTGIDDDIVRGKGSHNVINTGDGKDSVSMVGDYNDINTGKGSDYVQFKGDSNRVNTGRSSDEVWGYGGNNTILTETGDDKVHMNYGDYIPENPKPNFIDTGAGNDVIENSTDGAIIRADSGNDVIGNLSRGTSIDTGSGSDVVNTAGTGVTVDGEEASGFIAD
jgi:hypothetical protein